MTDKIQCAESIRRLAVMYQDMVVAADALEAMGSLEQAKQQTEKAAAAAQEKLGAINADIERAEGRLQATIEQTNRQIWNANEAAAQTLKDAQAQIDELWKAARGDIAKKITEANGSAAAIVAGAKERAAHFKSEYDIVYAETLKLQADVAEKQAESDRLAAVITQSREQISKMMGVA